MSGRAPRVKSGSVAARAGFSLVELQIALVVTALILTAMTGLFIGQTRLASGQKSERNARAVSRGGANALLVELRMVEATGGVEAASAKEVTLRVPYAVGVICATSLSEAIVSILPVDSVLFTLPGYSGYAWRDDNGAYTYRTGAQAQPDASVGSAACDAASITVLPSGRAVRLTPGVDPALGAGPGTPVLLYRRTRYAFAPDPSMQGDTALVRTTLDAGDPVVLAGPYSGSSRFRFFVGSDPVARDAAPADLGTVRGLQLDLEGVGGRAAGPSGTEAEAPLATAIYFNNVSN